MVKLTKCLSTGKRNIGTTGVKYNNPFNSKHLFISFHDLLRYENTESNPFDWLFTFDDVKEVLHELIPDQNKHDRILLVGAGNAPFSPDMLVTHSNSFSILTY